MDDLILANLCIYYSNNSTNTFLNQECIDKQLNNYMILTTILLCSLLPVVLFISNNTQKKYARNSIPFDIKDEYYDKQMKIIGDNKVLHRVILVRHGESEHNKKYDGIDGEDIPTNVDLNTSLTIEGKKQAEQVGDYLSSFNWSPDIIRISPMKRTRQTAFPFLNKFFNLRNRKMLDHDCFILFNKENKPSQLILDDDCVEVNVWKDQELNKNGKITKKESYNGFIERVKLWKNELEKDASLFPEKRIQTLVFTHSMVISEFLNLIVNENHHNSDDDEWSKIHWYVNHCSITCVDYTENGGWHIHAMNYSNYLENHTCKNSPFV
jgi:broad specificity phosphatase PhoE